LKERGKYPFPFNEHHERSNTMPLTQLVIVLIVVGVLLWVINRYIPMQATIKSILNIVVIIAVIIWLLSAFGIIDALHGIRIGK
jgi:Flp pilus assembly protein TadB